ncbi:MAG: hypothetical protein Aurels2KO_32120 [Aureliella sp.]
MRTLTLLSAIVVAALPQWALAADRKPVDGRWIWTLDIEGNTIHSELQLHTDGDKLTGSYKDENVSAEITDGGFDDLNVWFDMEVELNGAEIDIEFSGEYDADSINGTIEASINDGEETGEFDWAARRETRPQDVAGEWQIEFDAPDGVTYSPALVVKEKSGKLSGIMKSEEGEIEIEKIELKDHAFTFAYTVDYQGAELDLKYKCMPRGHKIGGVIEYSVDGNEGEMEFEGNRNVLEKQLLALVGTWKCSTIGPDGVEREPVLTTMVKDGKLVGTLKSDEIDLEIKEIKLEDGQAVFPFSMEAEAQTITLVWKCKADGDKLVGTIDFDLGNEQGTIDVDGKRQAD